MPTLAESMIRQGAAIATWRRDAARRELAQRLVDAYYASDEEDLDALLGTIFERPGDKIAVNLAVIKKFGNEKALMFRDRPRMRVMVDGEEDEAQSELWAHIYTGGNWQRKLRTANALEQVVQTLHLHPRPMPSTGKIDLAVVTPAASIAWQSTENPQVAEAVAYRTSGRPDSPAMTALSPSVWAFWSADANLLVELNERTGEPQNVRPPSDNPDGVNPYGLLPFVKIDKIDPKDDDYWNHGVADMLTVGDAANVAIVSLVHSLIHQGFSPKVAINMTGVDLSKHGPDVTYAAEHVPEGEHAPSMSTLRLDADFEGMVAGIEAVLQYGALMHGIPPSAFRRDSQGGAESGRAKIVDMLPLLEEREQDIPQWSDNMGELFAVTRAVWNFWHDQSGFEVSTEFIGRTFSDDARLAVDFAEVKIPETPNERLDRQAKELNMGIKSKADVLMENNPDLSREEAEKELQRIAQDTRMASGRGALALLGDTVTGPRAEPGVV